MHVTLQSMGLGEKADEAIAAFRADYTTRGWAMNTLFDGIAALLADLRAAGVRLAVATSKAEPTAQRILDAFRARPSISRSSPAPASTARARPRPTCSRTRWPSCSRYPERVLMVGDRGPRRRGRRRPRHRHRGGRLGLRRDAISPTGHRTGATHVATVAETAGGAGCLSHCT